MPNAQRVAPCSVHGERTNPRALGCVGEWHWLQWNSRKLARRARARGSLTIVGCSCVRHVRGVQRRVRVFPQRRQSSEGRITRSISEHDSSSSSGSQLCAAVPLWYRMLEM